MSPELRAKIIAYNKAMAERAEKASDLDIIISAVLKLAPGQVKKFFNDDSVIAEPTCGVPHIFTTGGVGWSVKFSFDAEWDEVPYRTVTFWAGHIRKKVPITESAAIIPPEILRIPFVHLRVSICGTDCIPDPESIARAKEIRDRQNEINMEFRECEGSEVKALMDEYMALIKERSELNLIKKRYITPWNEIGYIFPGATVPDTRG